MVMTLIIMVSLVKHTLTYARGNTNIKVGRQKLNTPLAGADDARMLPNLFEAAVFITHDIEDTTLILAHITRESVGTFGNVYGEAVHYHYKVVMV